MSKFEELVAKLSELFELDKADLDFGIHRIIKTKHQQISDYLSTRLPEKVKQVLGELAAAETGESLADLKREITDSLGQAAFTEDGSLAPLYAETPLGKRYIAAQDASKDNHSAERTEAEVYSHLYEFFSRYYEDGDFISRRRRTAGKETYAIPYDGEEVVLHWANKDQYYIKSSEDLKDYTFTVPVNPSGDTGRVQFKLTRMDAVQNNNKASRIFQIDEEADIEATDAALVIPFHFAEGRKRTKAAEAEWEQSVLDSLPAEWQPRLAAPDATYTGDGERTILEKHLRNYTKKNTSDYFIHKDLGGFLRRELDFYIKNEVMYLDDVDRRPADYLEKELRKIKAIRAVAHDLVDFLAQFEDFQKRLWLKKKFVIETNWCITLDRVPEDLYPEIAANDAQREEWVKLFAIDEIKAEKLGQIAYCEPLTPEFLKANDKLVLDTAFFPTGFKYRLLAAIEDIDTHTDGLLVHSENSQALALIRDRYRGQVQCVYTDPPYNTDAGPITYKNGFRHSSWLALVANPLLLADPLLNETAITCITIDDCEAHRLRSLIECVYPWAEELGIVPIKNNPAGRTGTKGFSICHEYAYFYGHSLEAVVNRLDHSDEQKARYKEKDELGYFEWTNFRKHGGLNTYREARPRQYYPIYVKDGVIRIPEMTWNKERRDYDIEQEPIEGEETLWPIDAKGRERIWDFVVDTARENIRHLVVKKDSQGDTAIYRKWRINQEGLLPQTWWDKSEYSAAEQGTNLLSRMFGETHAFMFPKSVTAVMDALRVAGLRSNANGIGLDYFAGSGTTGHAVISLNRQDDGSRKFILAEMGEYFDTVLKPRIQKVVYASDWKDGKPVSRDTGISHCFKYIRLESYEDALNNLELEDRSADLLGLPGGVAEEYLLRYSLDVETRASLLNLERFADPFNASLRIYNRETGEAEPRTIDLPETFNYLLGLRVRTMQMRDGFLVIEGENPAAETVLVIWRNVTETDNAALEQFVTETLRINPADTEYAAIYINGDTTLDDPHKKILLTEQVFHDLMFDVRGL